MQRGHSIWSQMSIRHISGKSEVRTCHGQSLVAVKVRTDRTETTGAHHVRLLKHDKEQCRGPWEPRSQALAHRRKDTDTSGPSGHECTREDSRSRTRTGVQATATSEILVAGASGERRAQSARGVRTTFRVQSDRCQCD